MTQKVSVKQRSSPAPQRDRAPHGTSGERLASTLCAFGLIYELVSAATGYLACVLIWGPKFYLEDIPARKNVWLAVQAISSSISAFVVGTAFAFFSIRNRLARINWVTFNTSQSTSVLRN